mgnify:CR=1 FL=1
MANIKEQAAAVNMLPNARLTAAQVINSVFKDGAYANIALGKALSKQNHSEQDRRFVTELVYGTVKAKGTIDWLLQQLLRAGHTSRVELSGLKDDRRPVIGGGLSGTMLAVQLLRLPGQRRIRDDHRVRRVHSGGESCNACIPVCMHSAGSPRSGAAPLALPANGLASLGNRSCASRFWYRPQAEE